MRALMTQAAYDQFVELRAGLDARGVFDSSYVFVPVVQVPDLDGARNLRVLFVGQATYNYDDVRVSTYEKAINRAAELVVTHPTPFFAFSRWVVADICEHLGAERVGDHSKVYGWTNLAKIGWNGSGNPSGRLQKAQASLCCTALLAEIALMKPHAVVIMTGKYAATTLFEPVFGFDGWTVGDKEPTRFKRHIELGTFLVHTYHPARKPAIREMAATIARLIAGATREES
jgi:hypothetical protein